MWRVYQKEMQTNDNWFHYWHWHLRKMAMKWTSISRYWKKQRINRKKAAGLLQSGFSIEREGITTFVSIWVSPALFTHTLERCVRAFYFLNSRCQSSLCTYFSALFRFSQCKNVRNSVEITFQTEFLKKIERRWHKNVVKGLLLYFSFKFDLFFIKNKIYQ